MHDQHRRLFVIVIICFALLGVIAGRKIQKSLVGNSLRSTTIVSSPIKGGALSADQKFLEGASTTKSFDTKSAKVVVPSDGISAEAYIAANVETDRVYVSRNAEKVLPVASMSKLVTAFAATDILPATTTITITDEEAAAPPDGSGISAHETYTLVELLYPLLLDSSNIAAEALASSTKRSHFLELMSSYAWEIGMSTAYFADPSGVNPHNAASAEDLFALAKYLYKFRPDILAITRIPSVSAATTTEHGSHEFVSTHPFVHDPNFIGGKTGRTPEAGDTMLTIIKIDNEPVAIVVLGSRYDGRAEDTSKIIEMVKRKMNIISVN